MTTENQYPAEEGLFTWPSGEPHLIAGKCMSCSTYFFPKSYVRHRPDCQDRSAIEEVLLSRKGKLDSYTIQHFPSPPPFTNPDPFVPCAIGWVSLPEGISIPGRLTGCGLEEIEMHMDVELVVEQEGQDRDGKGILIWKWRKI